MICTNKQGKEKNARQPNIQKYTDTKIFQCSPLILAARQHKSTERVASDTSMQCATKTNPNPSTHGDTPARRRGGIGAVPIRYAVPPLALSPCFEHKMCSKSGGKAGKSLIRRRRDVDCIGMTSRFDEKGNPEENNRVCKNRDGIGTSRRSLLALTFCRYFAWCTFPADNCDEQSRTLLPR